MIQKKLIFFSLILLLAPMSLRALGQPEQPTPVETTYEVMLHVLSTSRSRKTEVPASLSAAVKKLRSAIDIPELALEATYLERTSGSVYYKGPRSLLSPGQLPGVDNYCEWGFRFARGKGAESGAITIDGFRFGTRMPIAVGGERPDGSKPSIGYEWVGITDARFKLSDGEPTLVASLIGPSPGEMIFVFITVRPA